jgi:hypothetical protein
VPAKDRLGRNEERHPSLPADQPRQSGDERPIRPPEAGTGELAAQHGQLLAQHEDLRVLGDGVHPADPDQLDDASDESVEEAERHTGERLVAFANAGGGVYLTGERICGLCEALNATVSPVVNALVHTAGGIKVGGLGDAANCSCFISVNQTVIGGLATTPYRVTQWHVGAPGAMGNVAPENVLTFAGAKVTGAAWGPEQSGNGRLVVLMDIDWLRPEYRAGTWGDFAQNIALFLSGMSAPPGPRVVLPA